MKYFGDSEESNNKTDFELPATEWYDLTDITGNPSGFYGIWCTGANNKEDAAKLAQAIADAGLACALFYSEDWSNLAGSGLYLVSAGTYETEAEAQEVLSLVTMYIPEAFIAYSGSFLGHH